MSSINPPARHARAASRRLARAALAMAFAASLVCVGLAPVAEAASPRETRRAKTRRQRKEHVASASVRASKARGSRRASAESRRRAPVFEPTAGVESFEEGGMRREREEWFLMQRTGPDGKLPAQARRRAWESRPTRALKGAGVALPSADALRWEPLGPAPTQAEIPAWGQTSGRINAIAFHPADANVVLVGASTGGVWRSEDGGETFSPASDSQVDVAVAAIAFSRSHPQIVYAAMGDNDNGYLGTGLLKSNDGGRTWAQAARLHNAPGANCPAATTPGCLPALARSTAVLVHPNDPNRVYLAQQSFYDGNAANTLTASGVYYSEDGGVNWTRSLAGHARDMAMHPANPQILYAGMIRVGPDASAVSAPSGVWKSVDGGRSWNLAAQSPYFYKTGNNVQRVPADVRLAVTPAAPERVYAYTGGVPQGGTAQEVRVEVSDDAGASWQSRGAPGVDPGQFGYNTYIAVHQSNPSVIYLGARDIFKSTDGGQTYTNLTRNFHAPGWNYSPGNSRAHPDQQAFAFAPGRPDMVFAGNDGGLYRSRDGGATFQPLNSSLGLTQFVGITAHPTDPNITYGGAQDNGSQRRAGGGTRWQEFVSGDGGRSVVVPTDPGVVFSTYIRKTIFRWTNNADSFNGEVGDRGSGNSEIVVFKDSSRATTDPAYRDRVAFYPPFVGNGVDRAIYFGTHRVWVSTDLGASWALPGANPSVDLTRGGIDTLSAIGVARAGHSPAQTIYTGSAQGRVMVSADGGATWADRTFLSGPGSIRFVESITVAPNDPSGATAYLTVGGYGTGHVFKTTNRGATWADISGAAGAGGLPNAPVSALLVDPANPNVIYAGTDVGVYRSTAEGGAWESFNNGLPPTVVTSFAVAADGKIQISTYGRGVYQLGETETATVQFDAETFAAGEADGAAFLLVRRAGNMGATVSVNVRTVDDPSPVRCDDVATRPNTAFARCDYATTVETVTFGPHEFVKSVRVPLVDDAHAEPNEDVRVSLSDPSSGSILGGLAAATMRITSDDGAASANPLDGSQFFVRQQYLDFLSREPEASGSDAWLGVLARCPNVFNTNPRSPSAGCDRVAVSAAFFNAQEFALKGGYVFRFYRLTLGRLPRYEEIVPDMRAVTGQTAQEVFVKKADFAARWVARGDFTQRFAPLSNADFVDALTSRYGGAAGLPSVRAPDPSAPDGDARVTLTRADLILRLDTGALNRAQVVRAVADSDEVSAAEFRPAFVAMQYFGYLRRDPEEAGFQAWLNYLNANPDDFYTMVNGFMNAPEYRLRFGRE